MNIVILDKNDHSYAVDCFFSGVHGIGIELSADCTNDYDINNVLILLVRFLPFATWGIFLQNDI